jgi:CoA:oxalate CoA-transferase
LCNAIGAPDLKTDPRYATNDKRNAHHTELASDLEAILRHKPASAWISLIEAAGVPCGPINNVAQVMDDPHVNARNMIVTAHDPDIGTLKLAGNPMKLSAFPDAKTRPPAQRLDEKGVEIRQKGFKAIAD